MDFLKVIDRAKSKLAAGISAAATSLTVTTGEGTRFPTSNFAVMIGDEKILVSSRATDTFTLETRGYDSTTAAAHLISVDVEIYAMIMAHDPTDLDILTALEEPVWSIGPESVAGGAYLDLRPTSGKEIRIENFTYAGNIEVYVYDGVIELLVDSFVGPATSSGYTYRSTNARYYRIKNATGGAFDVSAEGVYTTST